VYQNLGIPGTGISHRSRVDRAARASTRGASPSAPYAEQTRIIWRLQEDGTLQFLTADSLPLEPRLVRLAREQLGTEIQAWLEERAAEFNDDMDAILNLHHAMPPPGRGHQPALERFQEPVPVAPPPLHLDLWAKIWPPRRRRLEEFNRRGVEAYEAALANWDHRRRECEAENQRRRTLAERSWSGDIEAMSTVLGAALDKIPWPRETAARFDFGNDARTLEIDVDLPEIEDMPTREAAIAARGLRLLIRERSEARRKSDYARHVHAIGLRVVAEAFAALPPLQAITISCFTQRSDPATGSQVDEYLYSARIVRHVWESIDFSRLADLDPVTAFERFDLCRRMDRRANFTAIEPFAADTSRNTGGCDA
jgi:hypothetical protein